MRASHPRTLLVSLLPGVDLYTRMGAEADQHIERLRSSELIHAQDRARRLLEEAIIVLSTSPTSHQDRLGTEKTQPKGAPNRRRNPSK